MTLIAHQIVLDQKNHQERRITGREEKVMKGGRAKKKTDPRNLMTTKRSRKKREPEEKQNLLQLIGVMLPDQLT